MAARISEAAGLDHDRVRDVHLCAFPEGENHLVAALAAGLLGEETTPETFTLVAEIGGEVVDHIAFSPVTACSRENWQGYILAPLGVVPGYQGDGIGSMLVTAGMRWLSESGVDMLFAYGDPKYYGRFGLGSKRRHDSSRLTSAVSLWLAGSGTARRGCCRSDGQTVRLSCVGSLRDPALW